MLFSTQGAPGAQANPAGFRPTPRRDVSAHALAFALAGYPVFPVEPNGKRPMHKGWQTEASNDPATVAGMDWSGNIGIADGGEKGLMVLDFDTDKREGVAPDMRTKITDSVAWKKVAPLLQGKVVMVVRTPSGGRHIHVTTDTDMANGTDVLKTKAVDGVALDIRAGGGYVVAPGSVIDGKAYVISHPKDENGAGLIVPLNRLSIIPKAELEAIGIGNISKPHSQPCQSPLDGQPVPEGARVKPDSGGAVNPLLVERRDAAEVEAAITFIIADMKAKGEDTTGREVWLNDLLFPLATAARKGEPDEAVAKAIFDRMCELAGGNTADNEAQWASTMATPLNGGERGLASVFQDAKARGWKPVRQVAVTGPLALAGGQPQAKTGKATSLANVNLALTALGIGCSFNQRTNQFEVCVPDAFRWKGRNGECLPLDDETQRQLELRFSKRGVELPTGRMGDALMAIGDDNKYDPVKDYFDDLKGAWDSVERAGCLLVRYAGAADTPFNRGAGLHWLVGAVKRTYQPGAKHDEVLALIGAQGTGKSSFGRGLATIEGVSHFKDADVLGLDAKVVIERTGGGLIIEMGEVKLTGRDGSKVKAFLSTQSDSARMSYGKLNKEVPRRSVIIATGNSSTFLTDPTGNRRWHVAKVGTIDLVALERDRDQIWAEAVATYEQRKSEGKLGFDPALWAEAEAAAANARIVDPWEDALPPLVYGAQDTRVVQAKPAKLTASGTKGVFTPWTFAPTNTLLDALDPLNSGKLAQAASMRLSKVATALGWVKYKQRVVNEGNAVWGYLVPAQAALGDSL